VPPLSEPLRASGALRPHTPDAWAQVLAGGHLTRYHRLGTGHPVLLLDPAAGALWPAFAETLAAHVRVLAPALAELHPDAAVDAAWLRDFVDALGVGPVALVAAPTLGAVALALADDAERVSCATLVTADGDGLPVGAAAVPLLVLPRTLDRQAALEMLLPFLAAVPAPP